jgi:hypothetical protein
MLEASLAEAFLSGIFLGALDHANTTAVHFTCTNHREWASIACIGDGCSSSPANRMGGKQKGHRIPAQTSSDSVLSLLGGVSVKEERSAEAELESRYAQDWIETAIT